MSFYFDDFDDLGSSAAISLKTEDDDNVDFICDNCGSTESYLDESTGNLFCSSCFTQSQNAVSQEETGLDFEDIMGLAARGKSGNLLKKNLHGPTRKERKKKPLEEFDKSKPLPDLKKCISGFQTVLREGAKCVAKILCMDDEEQEAYLKTIRGLWIAYLRAWRDGAEKYGALYPEMRFSLRDCFLSSVHSYRIKLVLAYRASKEIESELEQHENEVLEQKSSDDERDASGSEDQNTPEEPPSSVIPGQDSYARAPEGGTRHGRRVANIKKLAESFPKGREESALALHVSMVLAASILWIPIARIGIIPGQLINWIGNGSLPIANAFEQLLSPNEQQTLSAIRAFFLMPKPPTAYLIEKRAAYLVVAAGLKSPASLAYGIHGPSDSHGGQSTVENKNDDSKVDEGGAQGARGAQPAVLVRRVRFVAAECVPNMIAQLVADLGFGQNVLDIALSVIGTQSLKASKAEASSTQQWLPPPLKRAHPIWIDSPEYALGVIAVACKMSPGWQNWSFVRPHPDSSLEIPHPHKWRKLDPELSETSSRKDNVGNTVERKRDFTESFIPWNEGQFRLMQNGTIKQYLDFLDSHVQAQQQDKDNPKFEEFTSLLDETCKRERTHWQSRFPGGGSDKVMLPSLNLIKPSSISSLKLHRGATEDPIPYLSYPNYESHARKKRQNSTSYHKKLTQDPFHPFYARLIEYIAYKTHTEVCRIHEVVAALDEEVVSLCERQEFEDVEVCTTENMVERTGKVGGITLRILLHPDNSSSARYTAYTPANKSEMQNRPIPDPNRDPPRSYGGVFPDTPDSTGLFYLGGEQPSSASSGAETDEEEMRFAEV